MSNVKIKLKISPSLFILCLSIVFSKDFSFQKYAMILGAATIHEAGHLLAAKVASIKIKCIKLDIMGAIIETDTILCSYKKEAFLCLSGPFMNIISVIFLYLIPFQFDLEIFKISSIFFAAVNLLPAKCFDGGRALSCLLLSKFSHLNILLKN